MKSSIDTDDMHTDMHTDDMKKEWTHGVRVNWHQYELFRGVPDLGCYVRSGSPVLMKSSGLICLEAP